MIEAKQIRYIADKRRHMSPIEDLEIRILDAANRGEYSTQYQYKITRDEVGDLLDAISSHGYRVTCSRVTPEDAENAAIYKVCVYW